MSGSFFTQKSKDEKNNKKYIKFYIKYNSHKLHKINGANIIALGHYFLILKSHVTLKNTLTYLLKLYMTI